MALGSTQPLTEIVSGIFLGVKGWPARKADNLTAICEQTVYRKCESLDVSQTYGPSRPVTGIVLPFICPSTKRRRIPLKNLRRKDRYTLYAYIFFLTS
jgi:hypothetical protein